MQKKDIVTESDIELLVHSFYTKARKDELLAPVFNSVVKEGDWDNHLKIMCDFWSTMLLYTRKYLKDPMSKHLILNLDESHFERWLLIFHTTVDELFEGNTATEAKIRATNIGLIMRAVIIKNE